MAHKNNHVAEEDFYKFVVEVVACHQGGGLAF